MTTLTPEELRDAAQRARESVDSWPAFLFDRAADELERLRAQVALPAQPTPEMLDALRTGSRRDVPSDELCRVRYAALLAAAPAQQAPVTMRQAIESGKTRSELRAGITSDAERAAPAAIWYSPALGDFVVTDPGESGFVRYAQAEPACPHGADAACKECYHAALAEQAPDNISLGRDSCFPAAEKTNPSLTVGDDGLPPLPHPRLRFEVAISPTGDRLDYSAKDMRAYARAALAARPAAQAEPVAHISNVARWKVSELVASGYRVCGYTMEREGHRSAVVFDAAVRWLTDEQRHALMFVEGSVVSKPAAQPNEQ